LLITHSRALEFGRHHGHRNRTHHHGKHHGKGAESHAAKGASFLAESVVVRGVAQWGLIRADHFSGAAHGDGWHWAIPSVPSAAAAAEPVAVSTCTATGPNALDRFLGGHCVLANGPVQKRFEHLPRHSQVRITGRVHFLDNWRGETAYLKVDQAIGWTQSHRTAPGTGLQLCGSERYPETRMSSPIDIALDHSADAVDLVFGVHSAAEGAITSLAQEHAAACERSFGIDDIAIYIR